VTATSQQHAITLDPVYRVSIGRALVHPMSAWSQSEKGVSVCVCVCVCVCWGGEGHVCSCVICTCSLNQLRTPHCSQVAIYHCPRLGTFDRSLLKIDQVFE
jgi:hypothetical protein